jgi:hypothetical protein
MSEGDTTAAICDKTNAFETKPRVSILGFYVVPNDFIM